MYANPKVLEIYGCETMEEFGKLVNNSFHGMVHPEDLKRIESEIQDQIEHSEKKMDYIQYRIIRKDGQIRWLDDYGHLEDSDWGVDNRLFYVFIRDITDTIKERQKERLLSLNRFYEHE